MGHLLEFMRDFLEKFSNMLEYFVQFLFEHAAFLGFFDLGSTCKLSTGLYLVAFSPITTQCRPRESVEPTKYRSTLLTFTCYVTRSRKYQTMTHIYVKLK